MRPLALFFLLLPSIALATQTGCQLDAGGLSSTMTFKATASGAGGAGPATGGKAGGRTGTGAGGALFTSSVSSSQGGAAGAVPRLCKPGALEPCYGGPPGTEDVGTCKGGLSRCLASGEAWGPCEGDVVPATGVQDCALAMDTRCDGKVPHCTGAASPVVSFGDTGAQAGLAVAVDAKGNAAVTGYYDAGTNGFRIGGVPLRANAGGDDVFVAEYDEAGNLVWAEGFGGTLDDRALAVAFDAQGKLYVAGLYSSPSLYFGAGCPQLVTGGVTDPRNAFVVKLDPASSPPGACLWATSLGVTGNTTARGVAADGTGHVWVVGDFDTQLTNTVSVNGMSNVFLAELDAAGGSLVAMSQFGDTAGEGSAVAIDSAGGPVLAGRFQGGITFVTGDTMTAAGPNTGMPPFPWNAYVAKLDTNGKGLWSRRYGDGTGMGQSISGVAVDPSPTHKDDVLVAGHTEGQLGFGAIVTPMGPGGFAGRIGAGGQEKWANVYGMGPSAATGLVADAFGNAVVIGTFTGALEPMLSPPIATAMGANDVFVVKLVPGGTALWRKAFGDAQGASGLGIGLDPTTTSTWITGSYLGTLAGISASPPTNANAGMATDVFVARLSP